MCQAVTHITTHKKADTGGILSLYQRTDPTRTATIRQAYAREMRKRFRELRGFILDAVVNKDVFGLKDDQFNIQTNADAPVSRRQFDFPRNQDKISAFMEWLNTQIDRNILEVRNRNRIGASIDQTWQNIFIEDTYKRGVIRANQELRKAGFPDIQDIESRGGISAIMGQPFHADRLGVLYTRTYNDLKGITDAMDTQISRVLTQGLADGDGPRLVARKLNAVIKGGGADLGITDTLGRFIPAERRAEILARTETIRAHHQGMMQEYRNWGLEGVKVQAELRTAGDDRVCSICQGLQGQIFTLKEVESLIPVHPLCRCIALPARAEDIEKQNTGSKIEDMSVRDLKDEYKDEYMEYRKDYQSFFDDLDTDELLKLKNGDYSNVEFLDVIRTKGQEDFGDVAAALQKWQGSPGSTMPTALRNLVSTVEQRSGNAISWNSSSRVTEMLAEDAAKRMTTSQYLKLRAFNQAYMQQIGQRSMKMYRGLGGPAGSSIREKVEDALFSNAEFTVRDLTLSGWTNKKSVAQEFAGDYGLWIEETFSQRSVFLHHGLLNSLTGAGGWFSENESLLFTGMRKFGINSLNWFGK